MRSAAASIVLLPAMLLSACVTTTTTSVPYGGPSAGGWRYGHVESMREVVQRQEGNPAAGAVAGALVGGLLGSAIGGGMAYDAWGNSYYQGNPAGALFGAVGGAMVGAAASQGSNESRSYYEVWVRFDDGALEPFRYDAPPPFSNGQPVALGPQGLVPAQ